MEIQCCHLVGDSELRSIALYLPMLSHCLKIGCPLSTSCHFSEVALILISTVVYINK